MGTKKGKRAKISDKNEVDIMHAALTNRDMTRTTLAEKLRQELKWERQKPQIEVLERKISWYRTHSTDSPEENPWSTAMLDRYPLQPEALPAVLKIWKYRIEAGHNLTIREAKWVSRFYSLQRERQGKKEGEQQYIEKLYFIASRHARVELVCEILKRSFDSTDVDRFLMGLPVIVRDFNSFLPILAEQSEDKTTGEVDGVEEIRNQKNGITVGKRPIKIGLDKSKRDLLVYPD